MRDFDSLPREEQKAVIDKFYDLFAGRLDIYAIRVERGQNAMYAPSNHDLVADIVEEIGTSEFGPEAVWAHLTGQHLIGAYPIAVDSTVRWFALDFDKKNDADPDPWDAAVAQAEVLADEAGLTVYIERSQGGKGFHVWGFLDGAINAGELRHALAPFIERTETFDRMFPNQDGVSETRPLGNLIALPLNGQRLAKGNSAFLRAGKDGKPKPIEDQFEFLNGVGLNSVAHVRDLFQAAGEYVKERERTPYTGVAEGLSDSFKVTHPQFGCEWVRWCYENPADVSEPLWYALACNFAQLEDGRELFHKWSEQDEARYDPKATDRKYDQAVEQNKPHTCDAIRELGGDCHCDERFPDKVRHPFDLVKLPFKRLVDSIDVQADSPSIIDAETGFEMAADWAMEVQKDPTIGCGYPFGFPTLDAATGIRNSDLIVIASRSGMGKSAIAGNIADNLCVLGVPCYFFSAEMSALQMYKRQLAIRAGVSATRMTTGQLTKPDWDAIHDAVEAVKTKKNYPFFVDDMSRSSERIFELAAKLTYTHGKGVVFIDYLQLLQRLPREKEYDAVTRITQDLQTLAKSLDIPVIALAQLNRTADDATADSETYDSWLKSSGEIEQASSVILFMLGPKGQGILDRTLVQHKDRHREAGLRLELQFNQTIMRFGEMGTWPISATPVNHHTDLPTVGDDDHEYAVGEYEDVKSLVADL